MDLRFIASGKPASIAVDLAALPDHEREWISERLEDGEVRRLQVAGVHGHLVTDQGEKIALDRIHDDNGVVVAPGELVLATDHQRSSDMIQASEPTLAGLLAAIGQEERARRFVF